MVRRAEQESHCSPLNFKAGIILLERQSLNATKHLIFKGQIFEKEVIFILFCIKKKTWLYESMAIDKTNENIEFRITKGQFSHSKMN